MLKLITICAGLLVLTTDGALGLYIDGQMPEGLSVHKVVATWNEAKTQCSRLGGVLASPINAQLLAAMKSVIRPNNTAYFIGTRAAHFSEPYLSVKGVSIDEMTAALDMIVQLDPKDGDCLSMDRDTIQVVPCCKRLPYMCYKAKQGQNPPTPSTMTSTTTEDYISKTLDELSVTVTDIDILTDEGTMTCGTNDLGYKMYPSLGSCYKAYTDAAPWDEAEAQCVADGGHLVVIDSEEERDVIVRMLPEIFDRWWIYVGLRNYGPGRGWKSVKNQSMWELYNSWIDGTGLRPPEYCCGLLKYSGLLDWTSCNDTEHPFVCEINKI